MARPEKYVWLYVDTDTGKAVTDVRVYPPHHCWVPHRYRLDDTKPPRRGKAKP